METIKKIARYWSLGLAIVAFAFMMTVLASALSPFKPYTLYSYDVQPKSNCINSPTYVYLDREIDNVFLGNVTHADVNTYWLQVGETYEVPAGYKWEEPKTLGYDIDEGQERELLKSQIIHKTPPFEGEWVFVEKDLVIYGWRGVWPHEQHVSQNNHDAIKVRDC